MTIEQLRAEHRDALAYQQRAQHFLLEADRAVGAAENALLAAIADADLARILAEKRADDHLADAADHADDIRERRAS